jgi:hypothetical protein
MAERRAEDSRILRNVIEQKLAWAKAEKEKGLKTIEKQEQQLKENRETIIKLDGVILALTDVLKTPIEENKEEKPTEEPKKD